MSYVDLLWNPEDASHLTRKDRAPGRYRAYVPDELRIELPSLGPEVDLAAADALAVLARADERVGPRGGYLNHLLIRSESISSSWIEGNRVTPKKLALAEVLRRGDRVALEGVANVRATERAIDDLADRGRPISTVDIERLQHIIEPSLHEGIRREQDWVGGNGWSPLRAEFVPPPETEVRRLLDNLAEFVSATNGNPIVRAAIAHAQFETIHPFIDGNGRTGRALIHTVLKRADALRHILVPISTVFAGDVDDYIAGLTAYRENRIADWVLRFARATEAAASNAVLLSDDIERLDQQAVEQLIRFRTDEGLSPATPRRESVVLRVLASLASDPVVTIEGVAAGHGVSAVAANNALTQLAAAGVLSRNKDHKGRLICWTADRHLALVALTERSNRIGGRDTANLAPKSGPPAPEPGVVGRLRLDG